MSFLRGLSAPASSPSFDSTDSRTVFAERLSSPTSAMIAAMCGFSSTVSTSTDIFALAFGLLGVGL